jgi:CLIP-associating protein 1/2
VHALEDSDPNVRDTARESVIAIFTAPQVGATARADLKKELLKQNVRKTRSDAILKRILGNTGHLPASSSNAANSATSVSFVHSDDATSNGRQSPSLPSVLPPRPTSVASKHRSSSPNFIPRPSVGKGSTDPSIAKARGGDRLLKQPKDLTQAEILADIEAVAAAHAESASPAVAAVLEPVYVSAGLFVHYDDLTHVPSIQVASARDLEHEFASMQPCFVGKETEFNWQDREKSIFRMRGMLLGGVHLAYKSAFIACIKSMVDNILKAVGLDHLFAVRIRLM